MLMFENICRACMMEGSNLIPIFRKNGKSQVLKMLSSICSTVIEDNDRLPLNMCMACVTDLNRCYAFRLKYENSENTLKSLIENVYGEEDKPAEYVTTSDCTTQFHHINNTPVQSHITIENQMESDFDITKMIIPKTNEQMDEDRSNAIIIDSDILYLIEDKVQPIERNDDLEDAEEIEMIEENEYPDDEKDLDYKPEEVTIGLKLELKCADCGLSFVRKKNFDNHVQRYHQPVKDAEEVEGKRKRKIVVKETFAASPTIKKKAKKSLDESTSSIESTDIKCIYCEKLCKNDADLKLHQKKEHPNKKHGCNKCGKQFTMLSTLKDHDRTHTLEKPFLCPSCGRAFSQNTNLKQHIRRHKQIKPFKCTFDECDNAFVSKGELDSHLRKHTGAHPFVCDTCSSAFTTSSSLVKHKRIHSGEKPYVCEHCNQRFTALGTLKNHTRIHSGEKPYKCSFGCERSFRQRSDMQAHVRTHTGERPYGCDICQARFHQSGTLRTHMKIHNKAIPQTSVTTVPE